MLKRFGSLIIALSLLVVPMSAYAGSFSGGSSVKSSPSISTNKPSTPAPTTTKSAPTYSSTSSGFSGSTSTKSSPTSTPTYSSSTGGFSGSTSTKSTPGTYSSKPSYTVSSGTSRPSYSVSYYNPGTWGHYYDGFTTGMILGSFSHPWGGYYGGSYYGWSPLAAIADIIGLIIFVFVLLVVLRAIRRSR